MARYYKITNAIITPASDNYLTISEIAFKENGTIRVPSSVTIGTTLDAGNVSNLYDTNIVDYAVQWTKANTETAGFYIKYDLGSDYPITHVEIWHNNESAQKLGSFKVSSSNDDASYTVMKEFSGCFTGSVSSQLFYIDDFIQKPLIIPVGTIVNTSNISSMIRMNL